MLNSNLPFIDLHGETREVSRILVNSFIKESIIQRNYKIVVVHGRGTGALKKEVHDLLKHHKAVERFYLDFMNDGCTIVELKQNIDKSFV